jgi:hypothetical protein
MSIVNPVGRNWPASTERPGLKNCVGSRAGEEARRQDVGDQALMRGLATACPNVRPRLSMSYCGHHRRGGHNASVGRSSTVASPPPPHANRRCPTSDRLENQVADTARTMAHMNVANSRATAVTATVDFLPLAASARNRGW